MVKQIAFKSVQNTIYALLCVVTVMGASSAAAAQDSDWSLDPDARLEFGAISADSATQDDEFVVDGDALIIRGRVGLTYENDTSSFRIEADRIEAVRSDEDRSNYNRERITAQLEHELSDAWDVQLRARYYDDLATAESGDVDELQGSIQITHEPVQEHRLRVRGTWRDREYDNGNGPQTSGDGFRLDAQYRHRLDRYHYLTFDLRTESIDSDDPLRGYSRKSARVSYTKPIARDLRVRPALEYLETQFDGRITPDGSLRRDRLLVPEIELQWWPKKWRLAAEAKYIRSNSNEPTRDREGYRLTLSVAYVF